MPLYAAYGSNMHPEQMLERAPHSPMAGTGWLHGWRLTFGGEDLGWEGALATVLESARDLAALVVFATVIIGLASTLPQTLSSGLQDHGVPAATAHQVANLPPVSILFAAFLGYNPIQHLVGPHVLGALSAHDQAALTGSAFFPNLISGPFRTGLHWAFAFAIVACLIGAAASLLRGGRADTPARKEQHEGPMARPVRVPARN